MSGIGVKLNYIYEKNTIITRLIGAGYSVSITIAPLLVVIGTLALMMKVLGFSSVSYASRELFASTVMYIFIFALVSSAPFNAVLSKYLSDIIFEEKFEDILPCFYIGLLMNVSFSCILGIPFCLWEYFVGHVNLIYVFTGFCGYISLVFAFYTMLYLSICKDYFKATLFYIIGLMTTFITSIILVYVFSWEITYSMLLSLSIGFFIIASLGIAVINSYFRMNSHKYRRVFSYFRIYWKLVLANLAYIVGLFIHNFVFWTTDLKMVVAHSFVSAEAYDMASCLAMFTNISASVIFVSRVEMNFHFRYKIYSEAIIGGRLADIEKAKKRVFRQMASELMDLTRIQFIISICLYIAFIVILPQFGFSGMVMRIYPCLAAGYFILFLMYSSIIFLYYFNDLTGSLMTSLSFLVMTFAGSILATNLSEIWYGIGLFLGAFCGWVVSYFRLRWLEQNIDTHIFCKGELLKKGIGKKPNEMVFRRYKPKWRLFKKRRKEKS